MHKCRATTESIVCAINILEQMQLQLIVHRMDTLAVFRNQISLICDEIHFAWPTILVR